MAFTVRQGIELFHLLFLRALLAKADDKKLFVLKGGCNLRFFFQSVRYSEDIDLDAIVIAQGTLEKKIDRLLSSPLLLRPLGAAGLVVTDSSKPKQTATTQRWKVGLRVPGVVEPIRTKIEISRREKVLDSAFDAVDAEVLKPYALPPFLAPHYPVACAVAQKIHALADRTVPQARDVFDLHHLFPKLMEPLTLADSERARLDAAIEHATELSFDHYSAQVVAYLEPEQAALFASRDVWATMQTALVGRLEALR